jgi:hypothetical protein
LTRRPRRRLNAASIPVSWRQRRARENAVGASLNTIFSDNRFTLFGIVFWRRKPRLPPQL